MVDYDKILRAQYQMCRDLAKTNPEAVMAISLKSEYEREKLAGTISRSKVARLSPQSTPLPLPPEYNDKEANK